MGKKIVYAMTPERTNKSLSNAELAFAGFFSAVPTTFVAAPVERVKVLLQVRLSSCRASLTRRRCKVRAGSSSTRARSTSCVSCTRRAESRVCSEVPERPSCEMDRDPLRECAQVAEEAHPLQLLCRLRGRQEAAHAFWPGPVVAELVGGHPRGCLCRCRDVDVCYSSGCTSSCHV